MLFSHSQVHRGRVVSSVCCAPARVSRSRSIYFRPGSQTRVFIESHYTHAQERTELCNFFARRKERDGIMRILLITDSHGKKMSEKLAALRDDVEIYPIVLPRRTIIVRGLYRDELQWIHEFDPEYVLSHMGHNDIVFHPEHNQHPLFITAAFHLQLEMAQEVSVNLPGAQIILSSMLPRVQGYDYTSEDAVRYNKIARRFAQMLTKESYSGLEPHYTPTLNRPFWDTISSAEGKQSYFDDGGLHLRHEGKLRLAREWMSVVEGLLHHGASECNDA